MKIAFIHYHLKPGGVTTVLKHQCDALREFGKSLLLCGEAPREHWQDEVSVIPGIAYDSIRTDSHSPKDISASILDSIYAKWPDGCDLIHIHNPTLAKNKSFLKVVDHLQKSKIPLLLQVHDFAEDGRPNAYFSEPYPKNCHWCVINQRDYGALIRAGGNKEGIHYLPNAVVVNQASADTRQLNDCILYPIRAIRRKNIGEAFLLSLFVNNDLPVRITLPPNSPVDKLSYSSWQQFASRHHLNIEFEAGLLHDFPSLMNSSKWILSCSIMEGFGFSFLESWQFGKAVWGRYLEGICTGFEQAGIAFPNFYRSIDVPLNWIGEQEFFESWHKTIIDVYEAYNIQPDQESIQSAAGTIKDQGTIDFGLLNEHFQKKVLTGIINDKFALGVLAEQNPSLIYASETDAKKPLIESNARIIANEFNLKNYSALLKKTYQHVINTTVRQEIKKSALLTGFLNPQAFSLLKWGKYVE